MRDLANDAASPTGTAVAGPRRVPDGRGVEADVVLGDEEPVGVAPCEEPGVVVVFVLDGEVGDAPTPRGVVPEGWEDDASLPMPATSPPPRSPTAAASAVHAPLSTNVRRSMSASSRWRGGVGRLAR